MARTITISEDAYDRLASLTEDDESFSEVIVRLSRDYPDVTRFSGAFPEIGESRRNSNANARSSRSDGDEISAGIP